MRFHRLSSKKRKIDLQILMQSDTHTHVPLFLLNPRMPWRYKGQGRGSSCLLWALFIRLICVIFLTQCLPKFAATVTNPRYLFLTSTLPPAYWWWAEQLLGLGDWTISSAILQSAEATKPIHIRNWSWLPRSRSDPMASHQQDTCLQFFV